MKSLAKDPNHRFPSADAMLDDIGIEVQPKPGTTEPPRSARRKARSSALLVASVLVLLLLLGGGGALASGFVGLPQDGSVADALSRMNPVDTKTPPPPPGGSSRESGSRNVAAVTKETSSRADKPAKEMIPVPNVIEYYDYFAREKMVARGFEVSYARPEYREGFAARGVTWATDPAAGSLAPEGSNGYHLRHTRELPAAAAITLRGWCGRPRA